MREELRSRTVATFARTYEPKRSGVSKDDALWALMDTVDISAPHGEKDYDLVLNAFEEVCTFGMAESRPDGMTESDWAACRLVWSQVKPDIPDEGEPPHATDMMFRALASWLLVCDDGLAQIAHDIKSFA